MTILYEYPFSPFLRMYGRQRFSFHGASLAILHAFRIILDNR